MNMQIRARVTKAIEKLPRALGLLIKALFFFLPPNAITVVNYPLPSYARACPISFDKFTRTKTPINLSRIKLMMMQEHSIECVHFRETTTLKGYTNAA